MNCKDIGTLRAYLDRELSDEDAHQLARHLDHCAQCSSQLEQLKSTENVVARAFASLNNLPSTERFSEAQAFAQARARLESPNPKSSSFGTTVGRFMMLKNIFSFQVRLATAGIVVLLALALIGLTPQGQVAAANFLAQFRAQKLQVVSVDPQEMGKVIRELSQFGEIDASQVKSTNFLPAASIAEASQKAGFQIKQPKSLPAGIPSEPAITVKLDSTLSFTFNVAKAREYLASIGQSNFNVPSKFDGAKLNLHLPSAVMLVYGQGGARPLFIGESGAPSGDISGNVTPLEMREFLLSVPGLSKETVAQLRAMDDWMNTLPIPLPKDRANWRDVDLGGVKALVVSDNTGLGSFVIWQQDSMIYGVGGQFTEQELLTVAKSLR